MAGYAVECALKAIIAYSFRAAVIPSRDLVNAVYTHRLDKLVELAGLKHEISERGGRSPLFFKNWAIVAGWSEASRYEVTDPFKASAMVVAVGDEAEGVLKWLRNHWIQRP